MHLATRKPLLLRTFVALLLASCSVLAGGDRLTQVGQEEATCARTADNFLPSHGPVQLRQDLIPYNGMDKGAWALARLPDGSLVVGGDFTVAGGTSALHVARWDPVTQEWSAMGPGLPQPVHEIVSTPDNDLYALTWFKPDSYPPSVMIYQWIGEKWEALPQPFYNPLGNDQLIEAMVWDGGSGFFLGGRFTAAAGMAVNGIVHWDGRSWRALNGALPLRGLFSVRSLAIGPDKVLYAGGIVKLNSDEISSRVFAWDGKSWSVRGGDLPGWPEAVAISTDGRLIAVIANNDSSAAPSTDPYHRVSVELDERTQQWTQVTSGFPTIIEGLTFDNSKELVDLVRFPANLPPDAIIPWEGSLLQGRWYPFVGLNDKKEPIRFYALDGKIYVIGEFQQVSSFAARNIAMWDGQDWNNMNGPQGSPVYGVIGQIYALAIDQNGIVTAGGEFTTVAGSSQVNNIARWDGKSWHPMGSGVNGRVTSLAVDNQDRVYAGGYFSQAGGIEVRNLARWDPAAGRWEVLVNTSSPAFLPLPDFSYVGALDVGPDGKLYAAGMINGGFSVAAWDGQFWQNIPGLFDDEIYTLEVDRQGRLYVGGAFSGVSGNAAHGIATWDAQAKLWVDLGSSLNWSDYTSSIAGILEGPSGSLYVGGNFRSAGSKQICHIARLTASVGPAEFTWTQLGGGLPWLKTMTLATDGTLYAVTIQPRDNGESDYQVVVLTIGSDHWSRVDGIVSTKGTYAVLDSLAVDPNGLLYAGGIFNQVGGFPASSFAIFRLEGE
jgi:hypothetical protein